MKKCLQTFVWACVLALAACSAPKEIVVVTAAGQKAIFDEVDRSPWALLPGGAVAWLHLTMSELQKAEYGPTLIQIFEERFQFAEDADVHWASDVDSISGAAYATVSLDWLLIARGRFKKSQINSKTPPSSQSLSGLDVRERDYAGERMLTSGKVAFCVLTDQTIALGSETAVRRVIEKVVEGRLRSSIPSWFSELLGTEQNPLTLGLDLDSNPVPGVLKSQLAFTDGLRAARVVGNFEKPGLNLSGAMTYSKPVRAKQAAEYLKKQESQLRRYSLLLRMMQLPQPIQRLQAEATDKHLQLAIELKGDSLFILLQRFETEVRTYLEESLGQTN